MKIDSLSHPGISIFAIKTFIIDFLVISFIYFLPSISHMITIPLYILDPMRMAVLICLVHTTRKNTFLIAVTIPLFSLLISSHPAVIKTLLITAELLINLSLFYVLVKRGTVFISLFLSIIISKAIYYTAKFSFIQLNMIDGDLVSTSVFLQWILAIVFSFYVALKYENSQEFSTENS